MLKRAARTLKNQVTRTVRRYHTNRIVKQGDGRAPEVPHFMVYEPTLLCNLHCSFCYVADILNPSDWRSRELSLEELDGIFFENGLKAVNITGGEPFVRKNLLSIFELLQKKGMHCDYITTNATMLTEEKVQSLGALAASGFLRHISVSIDGPEEFHDEVRGLKGAFQKTTTNIKRLRKAFRENGVPPRISVNTTLNQGNVHLFPRIIDAVAELGVTLIGVNHLMFATHQEINDTLAILGETDPELISTLVTDDPGIEPRAVPKVLEEAVAYGKSKGVTINWRPAQSFSAMENYYTPNYPLKGQCFYPFFGGRITYDGKVQFCPFIRTEMGDLRKQSLAEIWNGPKFVDYRKKLLDHGIFPACRRCCKVELTPISVD